jgi:hypothetical protein
MSIQIPIRANLVLKPAEYSNQDSLLFKYYYTDVNNCVDTVSKKVAIYPMPVAHFYVEDECITDAIDFLYDGGTAIGDVKTYLWDLGDAGATSDKRNPSYLYETAGKKKIKLTITSQFNCVAEYDTTLDFNLGPKRCSRGLMNVGRWTVQFR